MAVQDEAVVDPFGLVVFQRREIGDGGRLGFTQNFLGELLKGGPARPFEGGGVGDLPQGAAPLDDDAVDVAGTEQVGDPVVLGERIFMNAGDDYFGAGAILRRDAVLEVAGNGLESAGGWQTIARRPAQRFSSPQKRKPASRLARS